MDTKEKKEKKSEYIIEPKDIKRKELDKIDGRYIERKYLETTNLPFGLVAIFDEIGNYLALYGKENEIIKICLNNIQEANCLILGVIEAYRQVQSDLFNLGIID